MTKASPCSSCPRKKSSKSSQKKPSSPSSSARSRGKSSPPQSADGRAGPSRTKISYKKNGRTDQIIDWLTDHVDDRTHLFSDNVQDGSAEGRRVRTAKLLKMVYYQKIAEAVFKNDKNEKANYAKDPEKYAKSVEITSGGKSAVSVVCMPHS